MAMATPPPAIAPDDRLRGPVPPSPRPGHLDTPDAATPDPALRPTDASTAPEPTSRLTNPPTRTRTPTSAGPADASGRSPQKTARCIRSGPPPLPDASTFRVDTASACWCPRTPQIQSWLLPPGADSGLGALTVLTRGRRRTGRSQRLLVAVRAIVRSVIAARVEVAASVTRVRSPGRPGQVDRA
jgi:hypothetical protein